MDKSRQIMNFAFRWKAYQINNEPLIRTIRENFSVDQTPEEQYRLLIKLFSSKENEVIDFGKRFRKLFYTFYVTKYSSAMFMLRNMPDKRLSFLTSEGGIHVFYNEIVETNGMSGVRFTLHPELSDSKEAIALALESLIEARTDNLGYNLVKLVRKAIDND